MRLKPQQERPTWQPTVPTSSAPAQLKRDAFPTKCMNPQAQIELRDMADALDVEAKRLHKEEGNHIQDVIEPKLGS